MELIDTPNPNAKKIMVNHTYKPGVYLDIDNTNQNSMEFLILNLNSVESLFVGPNFFTVMKSDESTWEQISKEINIIIDKI